jgi:hypothetical protein
MWSRVSGWSVRSVAVQHGGLILNGPSVQVTALFSRNFGRQSPIDAAPHLRRTGTSAVPLRRSENLNFTAFVEISANPALPSVIFFGFLFIYQIIRISSSSDVTSGTEALHSSTVRDRGRIYCIVIALQSCRMWCSVWERRKSPFHMPLLEKPV